ncbi:TPA: hypothetical protein BOS_9768 [Bos taurus]|nr:TPA: hypothetical protein BOS_9768 [Bos taurus]
MATRRNKILEGNDTLISDFWIPELKTGLNNLYNQQVTVNPCASVSSTSAGAPFRGFYAYEEKVGETGPLEQQAQSFHTIRKYNEEESKPPVACKKQLFPLVKGWVSWSLSLTISDYILIRCQVLKPRSRHDKEQANSGIQILLLRKDSLSGHPREFPRPARRAHVEPPLLAAKPPASAGAREANRSASAAEPLVEVWPISHTFGVLIRRGWDFGKCAVDLAESDEERKRSEKPESPLVKYVRPQRPALFQHLTLNSDIQEGTKLESYHGEALLNKSLEKKYGDCTGM